MSKFSDQFAIINKIKSFVKGGTKLFRPDGQPKITETMARKIQQASYEKTLIPVDDTFTPPYISLSKQLQVENCQIFSAAVFNMANIARNSNKHRAEIIAIFEKTMSIEGLPLDKSQYLKAKLAELKKLK